MSQLLKHQLDLRMTDMLQEWQRRIEENLFLNSSRVDLPSSNRGKCPESARVQTDNGIYGYVGGTTQDKLPVPLIGRMFQVSDAPLTNILYPLARSDTRRAVHIGVASRGHSYECFGCSAPMVALHDTAKFLIMQGFSDALNPQGSAGRTGCKGGG